MRWNARPAGLSLADDRRFAYHSRRHRNRENMFEDLQPAPADKILALIGLYRADPRSDKVDLGVGVYKDEAGRTPVMRAVKEAEKRLLQSQDTKTYLGLAGDTAFNAAMAGLAFGSAADLSRVRAVQAPGGSGALRLVAELLKRTRQDAVVWVSDPTWPNHIPIMREAGLKTRAYPYFDAVSGGIRFEAMLAALREAAPGDAVLLHGCCHNPTGANLDAAQWRIYAASVRPVVVEALGHQPVRRAALRGETESRVSGSRRPETRRRRHPCSFRWAHRPSSWAATRCLWQSPACRRSATCRWSWRIRAPAWTAHQVVFRATAVSGYARRRAARPSAARARLRKRPAGTGQWSTASSGSSVWRSDGVVRSGQEIGCRFVPNPAQRLGPCAGFLAVFF